MLFKKNPPAMPEFIGFAFFDFEIELDQEQICTLAQRHLQAFSSAGDSSVVVIDQDRDSCTFFLGGQVGALMKRMPNQYPQEKLSADDSNRNRVIDSHEHWAFVLKAHDDPMHRQRDLVYLTLLIQAISTTHGATAVIPSPSGSVFSATDWNLTVEILLNDRRMPVCQWVSYSWIEHVGTINAASIHMDELFGIPNIEIIRSPRPGEETVDLIECAVLESIMRGPLHKRTKQWTTKTGVRYAVRFKRSMYDPSRKATQLTEI